MAINDENFPQSKAQPVDPAGKRYNVYQAVYTAIKNRDLEQAHNLLRTMIREHGDEPEYLLLMMWTAPTQRTARLIFRQFQRKHPEHLKARGEALWSGVAWTVPVKGAAESELVAPVKVIDVDGLSPMSAALALDATKFSRGAVTPVQDAKTPNSTAPAAKAADWWGSATAAETAGTPKPMEAEKATVSETLAGEVASEKLRARKAKPLPESGLAVWVAQFNFYTYLGIYMAGITLAEVLTTFLNPLVGLVIHGVLLVVILLHTALAKPGEQKFLMALALAPLIRLVSLSMPLLEFDYKYWYMVIGLPLLVASAVVYRLNGYKRASIGLALGKNLPLQLLVAVAGIGLGFLEYIILKPEPLTSSFSLQSVWMPALILLVFTGFLEELIFRGLMQRAAAEQMKKIGPYYISLLFAVLHIGYKSLIDLVFVFLVGFAFSLVADRTRSLLGITIAHGLTNISLFLIFPFVLAAPSQPNVLPVGVLVQPMGTVQVIEVGQPVATQIAETEQEEINMPAMWVSPPTLTPRPTLVPTATETATPVPTITSTPIPTRTASPTATWYYAPPPTAIATATWTVAPIIKATNTPLPTATMTLENTPTTIPTDTPTAALGTSVPIEPTATETPIPTATELPSPTPSE